MLDKAWTHFIFKICSPKPTLAKWASE